MMSRRKKPGGDRQVGVKSPPGAMVTERTKASMCLRASQTETGTERSTFKPDETMRQRCGAKLNNVKISGVCELPQRSYSVTSFVSER